MSAFVNTLRARPGTLHLGGADPMTIRVQAVDAWDVVAVQAGAGTPMRAVKDAAFAALGAAHDTPADFVMKLRGIEVRDEALSLADGGARDGSTFVLMRRRRRAVH
ncbi:MAG: hypothetical protein AABZ29_03045 [Gemmatimonadota bacterium]